MDRKRFLPLAMIEWLQKRNYAKLFIPNNPW
jgi:hypothetical protein